MQSKKASAVGQKRSVLKQGTASWAGGSRVSSAGALLW